MGCYDGLFPTRARSPSSTERAPDHFQVVVASPRFDGLLLVEQHRLVYDALAEPLADETIHELRIKTTGALGARYRSGRAEKTVAVV